MQHMDTYVAVAWKIGLVGDGGGDLDTNDIDSRNDIVIDGDVSGLTSR